MYAHRRILNQDRDSKACLPRTSERGTYLFDRVITTRIEHDDFISRLRHNQFGQMSRSRSNVKDCIKFALDILYMPIKLPKVIIRFVHH